MVASVIGASNPPRFTVITPTYNRARTVGDAIESVLAQTVGDFEYLVVDDGSTDDTARVVAQYADPRVRYIRHAANRGQSAACNTGLGEATGGIVAFLDSDDTWRPQYLERMSAAFAKHPEAGFAYCRLVDGDPWDLSGTGKYAEVLRQGFLSCPGALSVRRTVLTAAGGLNPAYAICNDDDLCFRLARQFSFVLVPEALLEARASDDSVTSNLRAVAREWDRLFTEYGSDIVAHCGHLVLASHRFAVADQYLACGELRAGLGQVRLALASLMHRRRAMQPFHRRDVVRIPLRLSANVLRGLRSRARLAW